MPWVDPPATLGHWRSAVRPIQWAGTPHVRPRARLPTMQYMRHAPRATRDAVRRPQAAVGGVSARDSPGKARHTRAMPRWAGRWPRTRRRQHAQTTPTATALVRSNTHAVSWPSVPGCAAAPSRTPSRPRATPWSPPPHRRASRYGQPRSMPRHAAVVHRLKAKAMRSTHRVARCAMLRWIGSTIWGWIVCAARLQGLSASAAATTHSRLRATQLDADRIF